MIRQAPVFCDNCSALALATLDGDPLCASCLVGALQASPDPSLYEKIAPLVTGSPKGKKDHSRKRNDIEDETV